MPERKTDRSIHRNFNTTFIILAHVIFDFNYRKSEN